METIQAQVPATGTMPGPGLDRQPGQVLAHRDRLAANIDRAHEALNELEGRLALVLRSEGPVDPTPGVPTPAQSTLAEWIDGHADSVGYLAARIQAIIARVDV